MTGLPTIHLLYENPAWLPPVVAGMHAEGFAVDLHLVWKGALDPNVEPAPGIWIVAS